MESGSDRILKLIRKNTTAEINSRARRIAKEHGIRFKAFTMIGHLGETRKEMAFYKGTPGEYKSFVATSGLSREELVALRDEVERDVRAALGLPPLKATAAAQYEHSMGQS